MQCTCIVVRSKLVLYMMRMVLFIRHACLQTFHFDDPRSSRRYTPAPTKRHTRATDRCMRVTGVLGSIDADAELQLVPRHVQERVKLGLELWILLLAKLDDISPQEYASKSQRGRSIHRTARLIATFCCRGGDIRPEAAALLQEESEAYLKYLGASCADLSNGT